MPEYTPTVWENEPAETTPVGATNMNKLEAGVAANAQAINQNGVKRVKLATTAGQSLTLSGTAHTIDGVTPLVAGDRILAKNQLTASQNGIWIVAAGGWARATDADTESELAGGTMIEVARGTANGGKVFRCSNTGAVTIGSTALTFAEVGAIGTYLTDGTTPLKYTAFLAAASGNHTTALQNAINALFSSAEYNTCLDLEGATITLTGPVTIPATHSGGEKSMINGEIEASTSPAFTGGDHMIRAQNVNNLYYMRLINVTMNGNDLASWIYWDIGNWMIQTCNFKNNKAGNVGDTARLGTIYNRAGLFCSDGGVGSNADAGFWIDNCWFATGDGQTSPSDRLRIGIVSQTGDNKIGGGTTMSYFRHSAIFEAPGTIIHGFHPFQGETDMIGGEMTDHTAVLKFTGGRVGVEVSGLYLGKGFMEISNESNTVQRNIGQIVITNMRAYMDNGVVGEAHIVVRDYSGGADGGARVSHISITNSYFLNGGSQQSTPTKLFNPAKFDKQSYLGIHMSNNTFDANPNTDEWEVLPQSNPCTLRVSLASGTSHTISYAGYFPFAGNPQMVTSLIARGGSTQVFRDTTVGNSNNATLSSSTTYTGDVQITATCNKANAGFVNG